jgi:hypothetical protein
MAYKARPQQLGGGVGAPRDTRGPGVDYASIIDAATSGASSLIQQAYLRRVQEQAIARDNEQRQYQRGRDAIADQQAGEKSAFEREKFDHERKMDEADLLERGYHTEAHEEPTGLEVPSGEMGGFAPGAISRAMAGGAVQMKPPPMEPLMRETVPAGPHFDKERSQQYIRDTDKAQVAADARVTINQQNAQQRAQLQADRLIAQQEGRRFMAQSARTLTELRARLQRENNVGKGMTGNALETARKRAAEGLMAIVGNDLNAAVELLDEGGEESESFRKIGVELRHLAAAKSALDAAGTQQSIRAQTQLGETPAEGAGRVGTTRREVGNLTGTTVKKDSTKAAPKAAAPAKKTYTKQQIDSLYKNAISRGADPKKAAARRDSLLASLTK